jgi:hypothetical protein
MRALLTTVMCATLVLSGRALAQSEPLPADPVQLTASWYELLAHSARITLLRPQLQSWVDNWFTILAVLSLVQQIPDMLRKSDWFVAFITHVFFIIAVRAAMSSYDALTGYMFGASYELQSIYATGLLGYTPRNGAWGELLQVMTHSTIESVAIWNASILQVLVSCAYFLVFCILGLCAIIGGIYAQWGYLIAKLVGLLFIPFVLIPELRHYFMNWLGLFLSVCMFNVVAGVIMPLLLLATKMALGIPHLSEMGSEIVSLSVDDGFSSIALLCFILIGCFYMFRAFAIAGALVGGGGALSVRLAPAMKLVTKLV